MGPEYDFFINDIEVNAESAPTMTTSAVVTIVRVLSFIPDVWRDHFELSGDESGDEDDKDGDGRSNLEEYWSDTDPLNPLKYFGSGEVLDAVYQDEEVVLSISVPTPTTNSRIYNISFATNLLERVWIPLGITETGRADGLGIVFVVTNSTDSSLYYRTRVSLP